MNNVSKELLSLTPAQRALLQRRLKEKKKQAATTSQNSPPAFGIQPRANQAQFPLSAGQYRLLAQEELSPGTSRYNLTWSYRLQGALDVSILGDAIRLVVERHEVLRTAYVKEEGGWKQYVRPVPDQVLTFEDFSRGDTKESLEQAIAYTEKDQDTPFDLQAGQFLRACIIALAPDDHLFFVSTHHLVADGWSFEVLFKEISQYYNSTIQAREAALPGLPIQYADFAAWQQAWLESEAAEKQAKLWEQRFAINPEPVALPVDRVARHLGATDGATEWVTMPAGLYDAAVRSAESLRRTPYAFVLAAFNALLHRYSRQGTLTVCTPISGRNQMEVEPLIGFFNNVLVICATLHDGMPFGELVASIAQETIEASERQDLPFERVAALPSIRQVPLNRVMFSVEDAPENVLQLENIAVESVDIGQDSSDFDLFVTLGSARGAHVLSATYKTAHFEAATIKALLENFIVILQEVSKQPEIHLGGLPAFEKPVPAHASAPDRSTPVEDMSRRQPENEVEAMLIRIWSDALGIEDLGVHDDLFAAGIHSLMAVEVFAKMHEQIDQCALPLSALLEAPTIAGLARRIQGIEIQAWSPVVAIQHGEDATSPLFCVHGAGGNVLLYRDLAQALGPEQTVYGVQSQGLDGSLPILDRIEDMAAAYVDAVAEVQPEGPVLLLGYCMGGLIALEMATQLQARGREVGFVAMLETYNWSAEPPQPFYSGFQHNLEKIDFHIRNYFMLSPRERAIFLGEKVAELKRRTSVWRGKLAVLFKRKEENTTDATNDDARRLAEVWRTNDEAILTYYPEPYTGRVLHFLPKKEYSIHKPEVVRWERLLHDLNTRVLPVYPAGMLVKPFVDTLAEALRVEITPIASAVADPV